MWLCDFNFQWGKELSRTRQLIWESNSGESMILYYSRMVRIDVNIVAHFESVTVFFFFFKEGSIGCSSLVYCTFSAGLLKKKKFANAHPRAEESQTLWVT